MSTRFKNPATWAYGLITAFIGGGVTVFADIGADLIVDGSVTMNLKKLSAKAAVGGLILAAAYLKKSPLPELEEV